MAVATMEILGGGGEISPSLKHTRNALKAYCDARWSENRRKHAMCEWDLTNDEARSICEATASASTIDKIWRHPNGGWAVLVPVLGAVIGQSLEGWLVQERGKCERERRQWDEREQRVLALEALARQRHRHNDRPRPGEAGSRRLEPPRVGGDIVYGDDG